MSAHAWTSGDVQAEVRRRLAEAAGRKAGGLAVSADESLRDDLRIDSLDAILLVLELEDRLGIDIDDDELAALGTVGELLALVEAKSRGPWPGPP